MSKIESRKKELFRQLKIVASRHEDIPSKLEFQKHEMHCFLKQLKGVPGKKNDRFILWSNYISNNFGLNWILAATWLIMLSLIWYTAIKLLIGQTHFNINLVGDEIGRFISFLNPAHRFNELFNVPDYKGTALLFDGLSTIRCLHINAVDGRYISYVPINV